MIGLIFRVAGYNRPHEFSVDEHIYARLGHQLSENITYYTSRELYFEQMHKGRKLPDYLKKPLFKHPPLYSYIIAASISMFGPDYSSAVCISILFGLLTIIAVFFLGQLISNCVVGLIAAFLLAIDPVHWICSEKIWMETTMVFFMTMTILFFLKGLDKDKYFKFAGMMFGLAILTKYPGFLTGIGLFLFALLAERRLFRNKKFWLIPGIAFLMLLPWLAWNIVAYGWGFIVPTMNKGPSEFHRAYVIFKDYAFYGVLIAPLMAVFYFFYRTKSVSAFINERIAGRGFFQFLIKHRSAFLLGLVASILLLTYVVNIFFQIYLIHVFSLAYVPETSWIPGQFLDEPWFFYIKRLPLFSPFYFFAFMAMLFYGFTNKKNGYLLVNIMLIFLFFTSWTTFQSRYILPAVPLLMTMAAYFIANVSKMITSVHNTTTRFALTGVFYMTIGFFLIKTFQVGLFLAVPNTAIYF